MGLQTSIDIYYPDKINFNSFIDILLENGWYYNNNQHIVYLANDEHNWEQKSEELWPSIFEELNLRFNNNKIVGLEIRNIDEVGVLCHILPNQKEIMMLLTINRLKITNSSLTNFSYYTKMFSCILDKIIEIKYTDVF